MTKLVKKVLTQEEAQRLKELAEKLEKSLAENMKNETLIDRATGEKVDPDEANFLRNLPPVSRS